MPFLENTVSEAALLDVCDLHVHYGHHRNPVKAVDGVSLTVNRGECVGLVGESGCGKSTLGRAVLRLEKWRDGDVMFDGASVARLRGGDLKKYRKRAQMIFQDPYGSLNPRRRVGAIIGDPFDIHGLSPGPERIPRVQELMELVGLSPEHYNRFPGDFSGGQRQRVVIARAIALQPT